MCQLDFKFTNFALGTFFDRNFVILKKFYMHCKDNFMYEQKHI